MEAIRDFFRSEKIEYYAVLPAAAAHIMDQARAERFKRFESVAVFLIPYKTEVSPLRNVARFAAAEDYHLYAEKLFERFGTVAKDYMGCCDNSPVDEKLLAAMAGLGMIGDNSLIINEKYGSFVFIAEIFMTNKFEEYAPVLPVRHCPSCGKCRSACPVQLDFSRCVSGVNQKKKIDDGEREVIRRSKFKWGCDLCQDVCPFNLEAADTPIEYFSSGIADTLTAEAIDKMIEDGSFERRAYAWRGSTIKRNLEL